MVNIFEACKRYYQQIGPESDSDDIILTGAVNGTQRIRGMYQLVPEMRVAPDISVDVLLKILHFMRILSVLHLILR